MKSIVKFPIVCMVLSGFALSHSGYSVCAQTLPQTDKSIVLETEDGMIVWGRIEKSEEGMATVQSPYGTLSIPLTKILRVDGDTFDVERGIIREHSVTLRRDGSATVEYLQPVTANRQNRSVNVLSMGSVLNVFDLHGEPLDFMAQKAGDYVRCTVSMPEYRLPAVRMQILQSAAALVQNNRLTYSYRYTPRIEQTFRLKAEIPDGAAIVKVTPEPVQQTETSILWEESLRRQQDADFLLVLELK